jgi:hypothetical protein
MLIAFFADQVAGPLFVGRRDFWLAAAFHCQD